MANPFQVNVPNVLEALVAGEQSYDSMQKRMDDRSLRGMGSTLAGGNYGAAGEAAFKAGKPDLGLSLLQLKRQQDADTQFRTDFLGAFGGAPGGAPQNPLARVVSPSSAATTPVASTPAAPVASSSKVWGDQEAVDAGLYDPPTKVASIGNPPMPTSRPSSAPQPAAQPQVAQAPAQPQTSAVSPGIQMSPEIARLSALAAHPGASQGQRAVILEMLKTQLDAARMPPEMKEYLAARAMGDPLATGASYTQWLRGNKQAGATAITNDMRGENAEAQALGKGAGERANKVMEAASAAPKALQDLSRMSVLLDQVRQGKVEPTRMNISAWAKSLGLPDGTAEALGLDPKAVGSVQALNALAANSIISKIGSGGFPANNFSDADRAFLQSTVVSLANDPRANKILVEVGRRMAQLDIEHAKAWQSFRRDPANKGKSFDDFEIGWASKIAEKDMFGDLRKEADALIGKPETRNQPGRGTGEQLMPPSAPGLTEQALVGVGTNRLIEEARRRGLVK